MKKMTFYVVYDVSRQMFLNRRGFAADISDARIYKQHGHASNRANKENNNNLAIIPLDVIFDPMDELAAVLGRYHLSHSR